MRYVAAVLAATFLSTFVAGAQAQDANITSPVPELERMLTNDPFTVVDAEISRPKAKGDITLRAQLSFDGKSPLTVKMRKAEPGADTFNNVPRYDLAAYQLQALFLDPAEYVVPPTALRFVPLDVFRKYERDTQRTFSGADEVLAVVQYWLHDIKVIADVYDPQHFASDAVYARHIGQLNILTYLIDHGDSNVGNFLVSSTMEGRRVYDVDNGVAFGSGESDRGQVWAALRVNRLPADAVERLRQVTFESLQDRMGVLAQWELRDGHFVAVPTTANLALGEGVRREGSVVQMGLKKSEVELVWHNLRHLLEKVDNGSLKTF